jgi:SAM-dependent methyltransferase
MPMGLDVVRRIRLHELELLIGLIPAGARILEIGAGVGWQAKELQGRGFFVEAIDLPNGTYVGREVHPVQVYDGKTIPFPDHSFDVVFSSNVLEHIPHIEEFQVEIHRVLRPQGMAVHGMPTVSWRFWTSVAHYPHLLKTIILRISSRMRGLVREGVDEGVKPHRSSPSPSWFRRVLYAQRHGEIGTAITELYFFSRWRWRSLFKKSGWSMVEARGNALFYTGYLITGALTPFRMRRWLAALLGHSVIFYVLEHGSREVRK